MKNEVEKIVKQFGNLIMNEFDDLEIELNKTKNIFSKTWCQKSNI